MLLPYKLKINTALSGKARLIRLSESGRGLLGVQYPVRTTRVLPISNRYAQEI